MGSCLLVGDRWQGWPRPWGCPRWSQKKHDNPFPIITPTATPALILAAVCTLREGRHQNLKESPQSLYFLKDPTFQDTHRKRNHNSKMKTSPFIMISQFSTLCSKTGRGGLKDTRKFTYSLENNSSNSLCFVVVT